LVVRRLLPLLLPVLAALAVLPALAEAKRGACVAGQPVPRCEVWTAKVVSVNDGDTIDVDLAGDGTSAARRIRFTGVQAMEQKTYAARHRSGDCHAVEATLRVERLIRHSGNRVRLAAEDPLSTAHRRLLRTVAVRSNGRWTDLGTILVREGLALWMPLWAESAPNAAYSVLGQQARAAGIGLYDPDACGIGPSAASPLKLWVNWDADGRDTSNAAGEWVKLRNLDPVNPVPLGGWYVRDSGLRRFTFPPAAVVGPGATLTVNVGEESDGVSVFAWNQRAPVFGNVTDDTDAMGDGAYLFDPLGNVRASMIYPCRFTCTDPLQGAITIGAEPDGQRESVTLTNVSAGPVDLDGYVLKSAPQSYHFAPGSVIQPGGSLVVRVIGDPDQDTATVKRWGFARTILRNAGDVVELRTYTDIRLACAAWGDRSC
jgi:endonuclease YncB( thermonuclease family)